ncbi:hypothetical protein H6P81_012078 [Aristolochia fimbriata]|uniref:Protein LAZY 1 n=1 Tax=Aristolochia fimbriata TaxID=158543 RepID=A0AAV7EAT0_ARIFI|nr:hypothetical protein H6P81_012078 [Aristolochia fimbriata]
MKLLGWMHRKFRQNSSADPLKDFAIDHRTPLEDPQQQQLAPKLSNFSKCGSRARHFRKSFTSLVGAGDIDDYVDDPDAEDDLFRGLLAIGTLGSDPNLHDSSSAPAAADKHDTHDAAWATGDEPTQKTETVPDPVLPKPTAEEYSLPSDGPANGNVVCPLQRYLLGSPVEISATTAGKKEQRTSLGDLFMKEEGRSEEKTAKDTAGDRSSVHKMKKMLKRRTNNHGSSRHHGSGGDATAASAASDPASAETKLRKILHIFHRKVHPENAAPVVEMEKGGGKYNKMKKDGADHQSCKGSAGDDECHNDRLLQDEHDIIIHPMQRPMIKKENIWHCNYNSNLPFTLGDAESNGNREYWVKTDADYLVLEL